MNIIRHDQRDAALKAIAETQGRRSAMPLRKYSEDQERDEHGRFAGGGGGSDSHGGSDPSGHGSDGAQANVDPNPNTTSSVNDYNSQLQAYSDRMSQKSTEDLKNEHDKLQSKLDAKSGNGRLGSGNSSRSSTVGTRDKRDEIRSILHSRGVEMPPLGSKFN